MATQSLYRRYRPRRFSELKGQDHVVRALRNAVRNHREGQAYLFSGPRGTGKTTSARILAKVLNCEMPDDGEPCCQCASCLAVEAGSSFDVFELDAASNNGVDEIRNLIEKASLGTPGRHKVYILDEVHMLSKPASAALLKTLEEPPEHVVFVLATTDPQKVLETIRSRTQHLQFHLLPADELEQHVRWVAADAGYDVTDELIEAVLRQGGGSARDTLSALELAITSGGLLDEATPVDEFVEALIEADTGRVLAAVAHAVQSGREPRALTEDLVRHLRNCFLALMAPELVQLSGGRAEQVSEQARRLGAGQMVKAMETLGDVLLEMRHAPDPRLLVEVALVKLTHREIETGVEALLHRVEQLERAMAQAAATPAPAPVERDPTTGRARLGARAGRDPSGAIPRPAAADPSPADHGTAAPGVVERPQATAPTESAPPAPTESAPPPSTESAPPSSTESPPAERPRAEPAPRPAAAPARRPAPDPTPASPPAAAARPAPSGAAGDPNRVAAVWAEQVLPALKPIVRALYAAGTVLGPRDGGVAVAFPNDPHRGRAEQHRAEVERAVADVVGGAVTLVLVVESDAPRGRGSSTEVVESDDDIDLTDLVDAPPEHHVSPVDRLAQAFPGSELLTDEG